MRQKHQEVVNRPHRDFPKESEAAPANLDSEGPDPAALEADHRLAQRCVAGEVAAWEELYARCYDPLLASVKALLGSWGGDADLVEEIAAQVWYALVANDGELLARYNPRHGGGLTTYMGAIAKRVISRHMRSERRRLDRESKASRGKPPHHAADLDQVGNSVDDFLGTLGPGERQFCNDYLLNSHGDGEGGQNGRLSRAGFWQRTRRIYRRLLGFLEHGS